MRPALLHRLWIQTIGPPTTSGARSGRAMAQLPEAAAAQLPAAEDDRTPLMNLKVQPCSSDYQQKQQQQRAHLGCKGCLAAGPRAVWDSGLTCAFLASLIMSFTALFVKLTGGRVPVLEIGLVRSAISLGLSLLLMGLSRMPPRRCFGRRENLHLLLLRGCCGACSMTLNYVALLKLPLGDAVTVNLIKPPATALLARLLLHEPLGYRGGAGCCVSLAGVLLVARPPFLFGGHAEWARARAVGTLAGIVSAALGGLSSITIRLIGASEPAAVVALYFHAITAVLSAGPLLAGWPTRPVLLSHHDGGLLVGAAGTSFMAQLLSTCGLQRSQAAKAATMNFTQVLCSTIMGAALFNERLTLSSCLGALLILAGVLLVTSPPSCSGRCGGNGRPSGAAIPAAPAAPGSSAACDVPLPVPGTAGPGPEPATLRRSSSGDGCGGTDDGCPDGAGAVAHVTVPSSGKLHGSKGTALEDASWLGAVEAGGEAVGLLHEQPVGDASPGANPVVPAAAAVMDANGAVGAGPQPVVSG